MLRPALFLDRDGVINVDYGYVHRPKDFEFIPEIFHLVRAANKLDYRVVVVTNQAGIARGYYSEEQFHELTEWMCECFLKQSAKIDGVYFCPFHPEHGLGVYKKDSEFRKPRPGMLLQAQRDLNINMDRSILIGDKISDMNAGRSSGVRKLFFLNGEEEGCVSIKRLSDVLPYIVLV